jgi:hypothetical protein
MLLRRPSCGACVGNEVGMDEVSFTRTESATLLTEWKPFFFILSKFSLEFVITQYSCSTGKIEPHRFTLDSHRDKLLCRHNGLRHLGQS